MPDDNPLEAFRQVLAGATRAIAARAELELGFTADAPSAAGKSVKVPMPGRTLGRARGGRGARLRRRGGAAASGTTMRALHARGAPADEVARAVFDAAEQARVEALGARGMDGVRANLARAAEMRMRTDPIDPRPQPRRGAAGYRDRPDGARAADRRGAAARPRAAGLGLVAGLDRGERRRRSRRARPRCSTTRPPSPRWPPSCCATSSWSRASPTRRAEPGGRRGRGRRQAEGGEQGDEEERRTRAAAAARPRCASSRSEGGEEARARLVRGGDGRGRRRAWARKARRAMLRSGPNRPLSDLPPQFDYRIFTTRYDEVGRGRRAVRRGGTGAAARLSRPAAHPSAGRGHQARQPAAAAADGAAVALAGISTRRKGCSTPPGWRGWSSIPRTACPTRSSATPSSATRSSPC